MAQQRRLAGAVAAHQRHALARRDDEVDPAQDRAAAAQLVPDALERERGVARCGAAARRGRRRRDRRGARRRSARGRAASRAHRARTPAAGAARRARTGAPRASAARARARPPTTSASDGAASQAIAPSSHHHDAVGVRQAALEPVLGEHDRRPPLLVEPAQQPDELVARDGIQLRGRLVEQHDARARPRAPRRARRAAARHRTARASGGPAAPRSRAPAPPPPPRAPPRRRPAAVLQRKRQLGAHGRHHRLGLRVLEERAGDRREIAGAVLARVHPADDGAAGECAAVEVRDEAGGGAQQRRLARGRQAGEHARTRRARRRARRRAARRARCRDSGR